MLVFLWAKAPNYRPEILERSAKYAPGAMRYVCVGADSIRPVVFPPGKQRRRKAPTMQYQTFANEIRRYHVETWHICNVGTPVRPIRFCSKICYVGGRMISVELWSDRPRRSLDFDSLRGAPPYGATKYPPGESVAKWDSPLQNLRPCDTLKENLRKSGAYQ